LLLAFPILIYWKPDKMLKMIKIGFRAIFRGSICILTL